MVELGESSYYAEGDTLTVEVVRDGALNTIAEAKLTTESGSAQAGRDFSPVDMSVVFPMGIDKRTIEIPIRTDYFVGEADFSLKLEAVSGCEIGNGSAQVTMTGTAGADGSASTLAVEQSARLEDIVLGSPIDLSGSNDVTNSAHFGGTNRYDSNGKEWVMQWKDNYNGWDHFWGKEAEGTTSKKFYIYDGGTAGSMSIAGAQIDWARSGSCANIKVELVPMAPPYLKPLPITAERRSPMGQRQMFLMSPRVLLVVPSARSIIYISKYPTRAIATTATACGSTALRPYTVPL